MTAHPQRIPYTLLVAGWAALIVLSVLYCEGYRLAHGAPQIDLRYSATWMAQIWSSWLIAGVGVSAWSGRLAGRRTSRTSLLALITAIFATALCAEWVLNIALASADLIERFESFWALFNRRAFACLVLSAALARWALQPQRKRQDASVSAKRAPAALRTVDVMTRSGPLAIALSDVEAVVAAENYVQICTSDGKQHLLRTPLRRLEEQLAPEAFKRVHRSSIVNVRHVDARLPGWRLRLTSGRIVRVGRSYRDALEV